MRRGVNIGNALDVDPSTTAPGGVDEAHLDEIAGAGFDTVRLPVRWTAHTTLRSPFQVDDSFADVVERTIDAALDRDLEVVMDVHHAVDVMVDVVGHEARFAAVWSWLAARFAAKGPGLAFELLNEPKAPMTAAQWNRLLRVGLAAVRDRDRSRPVVIGPAEMGTIVGLAELDLPNDPHLVATIHYYEPFAFTHQGAPWEPGSEGWLGTEWGSAADERAVRTQLEAAAAWARSRALPLLLGEFGTYALADPDSRVRWTHTVRREAERLDVPWCYWDFSTDFGVFDPSSSSWRPALRDALLAD